LLNFNAVNRRHLLTGKAPRTGLVRTALATTKGPLVTVADTGIFCAGNAFTVSPTGAGSTKIGEVRDTDEGDVGVSGCHLAAGPTWWTLFLAGNGADFLSHMLNTPPGETVRIALTLIKKTSFARVARQLGAGVTVHHVEFTNVFGD
jgi:hypothetical protein